jgi:hypothetical protein
LGRTWAHHRRAGLDGSGSEGEELLPPEH